MTLVDVVDDRLEFADLAFVDQIGMIGTGHGSVRRDRHHTEAIGVHQLGGLGGGRTGHTGQLVVHAEIVLQGDRGEGLVLLFDLDALFGLDGLMDAL